MKTRIMVLMVAAASIAAMIPATWFDGH